MDDIAATVSATVEEATAAMDLSGGDDISAPVTIGGGKSEDQDAAENPLVARMEDEGDSDDDDDDKMDTSSTSSKDPSSAKDDMGISPEKAEIMLIKATSLKELGNQEFKGGELDKAARSYRRGVAALKKLNHKNTGDEQVKALLVMLYTNLSTVLFKSQKYRVSADVAGRAIGVLSGDNSNSNNDSAHVKALYRRAVAHRKVGNLDEARRDLRAAVAMDPANTASKKELASIKKEMEAAKETQKKALSRAFQSGNGSSLYDDKQELQQRREEEAKRKKQAEEELLKKRKELWEDECVSRMAKGEDALSFDDWDKQRVEKEEAEQKANEDKRNADEKRRKEEQRKAKLQKKATKDVSEKDEDDDELTEAELAMMRGYKKTADGRTTSYFTRELSEEEKRAIGDIAPKRLDENAANEPPVRLTSTSSSITSSAEMKASGSAWNQAGTWEEKDTTSWCTAQLRKRLDETTVTTDKFDIDVVKIPELTGDASVANVSGKKRYIFDFHVKLKYEIKEAEEGKTGAVIGSGVIRIPDICSTHHEEIAVDFEGWKKCPVASKLDDAMDARHLLVDQLRASVQRFVADFNETY